MIAEADGQEIDHTMTKVGVLRTELDFHANMVVVGQHCYIIGLTGETMDVSWFTPDYESLKKVPLVDAALMYLCEHTVKESLIVVRNALYVP